jgi:hypothetical protein
MCLLYSVRGTIVIGYNYSVPECLDASMLSQFHWTKLQNTKRAGTVYRVQIAGSTGKWQVANRLHIGSISYQNNSLSFVLFVKNKSLNRANNPTFSAFDQVAHLSAPSHFQSFRCLLRFKFEIRVKDSNLIQIPSQTVLIFLSLFFFKFHMLVKKIYIFF